MAKSTERTETAMQKVAGAIPSFLAKTIDKDESLAGMQNYRIIPRGKIVQSMSAQAVRDMFPDGSLIIRPGDTLVQKWKEPGFLFVPLLFTVEYIKWADRNDNTQSSVIIRTSDPTSDVAIRAKDAARRIEDYPGQESVPPANRKQYRYVEHLNFTGLIYGDNPAKGEEMVYSFSRGDFSTGRKFIDAIQRRKIEVPGVGKITPPLWSQVWELSTVLNEGNNKKWYGMTYKAPTDASPYITDEEANDYQAKHVELLEAAKKGLLIVNQDEGNEEGTPVATEQTTDM